MKLIVLSLTLTGCIATQPVPIAQAPTHGCGYTELIGKQADRAILPHDLSYRIIGPGEVITLDHNPDRVNFETSKRGTVTRVWCG